MNFYKTLKQPFFGSFMVKWRNPLTTEAQNHWEQVKVTSKSGGTIVGLFARTPQAKATIVLGHPMGKEAKGYFLKNGYTDLLRNNGYNVLIFDINGFGESTHGNFFYFEDITAISIKAKELTPQLKIGYHGVSLGAQWATISFADHLHCYDFAIVESAATTLEEFWIHFPVAYRVLKTIYVFTPRLRRKIQMVNRIKEAQRLQSILFIYSETDNWTTVSMGKRFRDNCPIKSELWTVPEAKHAMIIKSSHSEAYKQKILDYFNQESAELKNEHP
ncbi:MAG: alpha/beta hydrolase [Saprospiraceae bacterium]|nr:alpha/beta hydrolase [Saprospiraceae bacterium]